MKILIVDDNPDNRYMYEVLLKGRGHEVVSACNGLDALEKLKVDKAELIVSDIMMPKMDGYRLCRACKMDESLKSVPFIFITSSYVEKKDEELALNLGADRFIRRPIEPDDFMRAVEEVIKGRGMVPARKQQTMEDVIYLSEYNERLANRLEQKVAELELEVAERKSADEELRRLAQKNELILNSAGEGIYGVDVKGRITFINPSATAMLGWEVDELIGRHPHQIWHYSRLDGSEYPLGECPVMNALNRGIAQQTSEEVFLRKDGSAFQVEYTSTPMWEDSRLVGAVVTFKDITDRKQAEDALRNEVAVTGALLEAASITSRNVVWGDVTDNVVGLVHELTAGKSVLIFRLAGDGILIPQCAAGLPAESLKYFYALRARVEDISSFKDVINTKATLMLDRGELEEFGLSGHAGPLGLLDLLLSPIITRGEAVGFLCVNFDRLPTDPRVAKIIEGIARQLGVAYDNSQLYMETQNKSIELARSLETLKVLSEIDKKILSSLDRDEMMEGAMSQIRRVAPADVAGVVLLEEETGDLRFCYGWCLGIKIGDKIHHGQYAGYPTLKTGKTLVRGNLGDEAVPTEMDKALLEGGIKSDIFVPIISKGKGVGLLHIGSYRVAGFTLEDVKTIENLANQLGIALENARLLTDLEEMFISVVTALASAIDAKSHWTKGHSERVTRYAIMIAGRMGLSHGEVEGLRLAGLLHDVGKIGTYDVILDKPVRLTGDEFDLVKRHPAAGAEILMPIKQFRHIIPAIRHHHERWDGNGYPDGLKGEEIPLLARILCVADSFDSMTADRPYRPSPGIEYATEEFRRCAGSQFDPAVVDAFIGILEEMKEAA